jgi:hypothetical protein
MGKFGAVANIASQLLAIKRYEKPIDAWNAAALQVFESTSQQEKGCPRDTFLALCGAGVIADVPAGSYTRSVHNREYALRALQALRGDANLLNNQSELWRIAVGNEDKEHNSQMDVISTLWRRGWIE